MCVELRLHFLLLDAILQAPQLAEAEGTDLESARGGRTLAALRALLAGWAADATARCTRDCSTAWRTLITALLSSSELQTDA